MQPRPICTQKGETLRVGVSAQPVRTRTVTEQRAEELGEEVGMLVDEFSKPVTCSMSRFISRPHPRGEWPRRGGQR
jgi:hypothetical protein